MLAVRERLAAARGRTDGDELGRVRRLLPRGRRREHGPREVREDPNAVGEVAGQSDARVPPTLVVRADEVIERSGYLLQCV